MSGDAPTIVAEPVCTGGVVDVCRPGPRERGGCFLTRTGVERVLSILSLVVLLGLWELLARLGTIDSRFFPPPTGFVVVLWQMLQPSAQYPGGELWTHVSISLARIAIGFLLGAVPGIVIGLAMGLFSPVRAIIQPLIDATFPIPKVALLPLFIMIFGIGEESKYAIIATAVIYLVLINSVAGVRNIDKIYLEVGKNFHASPLMMFTDIALPGALPLILTGIKLGSGVALLEPMGPSAPLAACYAELARLAMIDNRDEAVEPMSEGLGIYLRALVAFFQEDDRLASQLFERTVAFCRGRGERWLQASALLGLSLLAIRARRGPEALKLGRESVKLAAGLDDRWGTALGVEALAWASIVAGKAERGARLRSREWQVLDLLAREPKDELADYGLWMARLEATDPD